MDLKVFIYQRYDGREYGYYEIAEWVETCRGVSFEVLKMPFISGDLTREEYKTKSENTISRSDCVIIPIRNVSDNDDLILFAINTARQYDKPTIIVSDCEINNEDIKSKVNAIVKWEKEDVIRRLNNLLVSRENGGDTL